MTRRPDYPDGTVAVSTNALLLNGRDQFVDLPKDVADMRDCTYSVTFKWYGGGQDQRLFEFGNPNGDFLCMSPCADRRWSSQSVTARKRNSWQRRQSNPMYGRR